MDAKSSKKVAVFNVHGLAKTQRNNSCTIRNANSHYKRYLLTAINLMFMDQEQRWEVKTLVHNEQPLLTKYLQDSESQLPQPFDCLPYRNPAKNFLASSPWEYFTTSVTPLQLLCHKALQYQVPNKRPEFHCYQPICFHDYLIVAMLASLYNCVYLTILLVICLA
jgi:hypothetical protein